MQKTATPSGASNLMRDCRCWGAEALHHAELAQCRGGSGNLLAGPAGVLKLRLDKRSRRKLAVFRSVRARSHLTRFVQFAVNLPRQALFPRPSHERTCQF